MNSASGFNYLPSLVVKPFGQHASNFILPTVSARLVDITNLGGTIANVSMNDQKGGYPIPPKITADAGMSGHVPSFNIIPSLTYLNVKMTNVGYGYTTEPTVVITNRAPNNGGGAVAKAILGIPGRDGQSGPGKYTSNSVSAAAAAAGRDVQDFTVPGGGYTCWALFIRGLFATAKLMDYTRRELLHYFG
jgi:hypothetical protein